MIQKLLNKKINIKDIKKLKNIFRKNIVIIDKINKNEINYLQIFILFIT
jgi:hypothetical protein